MKLARLVIPCLGAAAAGCAGDPADGAGGAGGATAVSMTVQSSTSSPSSASTSASTSAAGGSGGGEPWPLGEPDCHPRETSEVTGAYFRKVQAEPDTDAVAIHTTFTLPRVEIDLDRWFVTTEPSLFWQNGPLDRPSVYLGGRASGVDVDAGLTWDRVYHDDGRPTWTDRLTSGSDEDDPSRRFVVEPGGEVVSVLGAPRAEGLEGLVENFAFRPFWRSEGAWHNPPVGSEANVYFFREEAVRAQIKASAPGQLELTINEASGEKGFSTTFAVSGWGTGALQSFKRVSSIDQFTVIDGERIGLETAGLEVIPTSTRIKAMRWTEVRILGLGSALLFHLDCDRPAVTGIDAVFARGYDEVFRLFDQDALGGETIDIVPPEP